MAQPRLILSWSRNGRDGSCDDNACCLNRTLASGGTFAPDLPVDPIPYRIGCRYKYINEMNDLDHRFSVAPMMDWTDRHCRVFHRLLTRRARLYTEMLTTGAIIHGDRERLLGFDASEHPVALQLGGSRAARSRATRRASARISATTRSISMSAARPTA